MFDLFARFEVRLDTGETIPCTSLDAAEHKAQYHVIYRKGETAEVLRNGKIIKTVARAPQG
jgi:hypothetical protein